MIPTHEEDGRLPKGIHSATWAEVVARFGGSTRRQMLLTGLHTVLSHLANAGCRTVFLGGSFVRTKAQPGDVDVVWDIAGVDPDLVHPMFLGPAGRDVTVTLFGCECFPSHLIEASSGLPFAVFFQKTRDGHIVGIVEIDLETL